MAEAAQANAIRSFGERMSVMSEVERLLLREQLGWYRLQRHDFLNHWQVVMGYVQLGQNDRALAYIRETLSGQEAEQEAGQLEHPVLAALLLGLIVQLRQAEILVKLVVPSGMKQEIYWNELWREEYADLFYGYTRECLADFSVHIDKQEGMRVKLELNPEEVGFSCRAQLYNSDVILLEKVLSLPLVLPVNERE